MKEIILIHLRAWFNLSRCYKIQTTFGHMYVTKASAYTVRVYADGTVDSVRNRK
jgi:hypothetical protein